MLQSHGTDLSTYHFRRLDELPVVILLICRLVCVACHWQLTYSFVVLGLLKKLDRHESTLFWSLKLRTVVSFALGFSRLWGKSSTWRTSSFTVDFGTTGILTAPDELSCLSDKRSKSGSSRKHFFAELDWPLELFDVSVISLVKFAGCLTGAVFITTCYSCTGVNPPSSWKLPLLVDWVMLLSFYLILSWKA